MNHNREDSVIDVQKDRGTIRVPFFTEIIILMTWSIWTTRNDWILNEIDPSVASCQRKFISEFKLAPLKDKPAVWLPWNLGFLPFNPFSHFILP